MFFFCRFDHFCIYSSLLISFLLDNFSSSFNDLDSEVKIAVRTVGNS